MNQQPIAQPRILITRTDRIGDLVLSTPVFEALRKKFPEAWIACLTFLENREIVLGNPYLNEVILYDKFGSERDVWGNFRFAAQLTRKKFDTVIHLHATNRMHLVTWLAGIPQRIGWKRKSSWALTQAYPEIKREGEKHEAEYNFDLLQSMGITWNDNDQTYFPLNEKAEQSLRELLRHHGLKQDRPWMVIHPSASCPSKKWPAEKFGHLMNQIAAKYKVEFILIGTDKDREIVEAIKRISQTSFYDLTGRLTLGMLGQLLKQSALLISNDSGPVHVAVAVKTPVISIFGRKQAGLSPKRWGPLDKNSQIVWKDVGCPTCLAHLCQIHFLCLDAISVEDVFQKVEYFQNHLKHEKLTLVGLSR